MSKFENVLKKYITEVNVDLDAIKKQIGPKIASSGQQVENGLKVLNAFGTSDQDDPVQIGLTKLFFQPDSKESFSDVFKNPSDNAKAIEFLTKLGFPIKTPTQQQKTATQQQPNTQKQTPTSSTEDTGESPTSYGGKIQGL
jgi:hypothetical protein